ncbi:MAG: putative transposase [Limisphaerales bacterium]|jgi:putative transposase
MQNLYKRHRFPPSVIQHAVWLYYRFKFSARDVEDLLAERNISVSYEAIRLWINKFGPEFTKRLRRRHSGFGDTYFLDEVFVKIGGKQHYLWRAVDQDGEIVDIYLRERRDAKAAKRFFQRFIKAGGVPREIVTDKLRSYGPACRQGAHRTLLPEVRHNTEQYANNRAELSHQPTRVRERGMRRFESIKQAQRILESHAAVYNLFNLHRHSLCRRFFKLFRLRSFATWDAVTAS